MLVLSRSGLDLPEVETILERAQRHQHARQCALPVRSKRIRACRHDERRLLLNETAVLIFGQGRRAQVDNAMMNNRR